MLGHGIYVREEGKIKPNRMMMYLGGEGTVRLGIEYTEGKEICIIEALQ